MTRHIADRDYGSPVGEFEPVVEIAADVAGGLIDRRDVHQGDREALARQPRELDLARLGQLALEQVVADALHAHAGADQLHRG